jgi:hypothetical protein
MITDLAAQHALDRLAKLGAAGLTDSERTIATVWQLEAGVGNSGFTGYLSSSRSDLVWNAVDALREIGAPKLAGIVAEANAIVFGRNPPSKSRIARRELVHALSEESRHKLAELDLAFENCSEDVDDLLEKYLSAQMAGAHR